MTATMRLFTASHMLEKSPMVVINIGMRQTDIEIDGVEVIKNLLSTSTIERWYTSYQNENYQPEQMFYEPVNGVVQLQRIDYLSRNPSSFIHEVIGVATGIIKRRYSNATLFKDKLVIKSPGGRGFRPHQDAQMGWYKHDSSFYTVAIPFHDTTKDNGALSFVFGRHKEGLLGLPYKPLSAELVETMDFVLHETNVGDVMLFNGYTPHYSNDNLTDTTRIICYITFKG